MRFGFALPQIGSPAGPEALVMVAKRAEDLGFDSLWVLDRILWPVHPRAPYPLGDGSLPVQYKNVLDPVETLTFAAARKPVEALPAGGETLAAADLTPKAIDESLGVTKPDGTHWQVENLSIHDGSLFPTRSLS